MYTKPSVALGLLILAGAIYHPSAASGATENTVFTEGDLLLGFHQIGSSASPNDLLVDIGPISLFLNATVPFSLTFGKAPTTSTVVTSLNNDLVSVFGASWASNSAANLVQWGVFGDTTTTNTFGLPKNTLFLTTAELTAGVYAAPLLRFRTIPDGTYANGINALTTGQFGFNGSISTTYSNAAVSQVAAQSNSYVSGSPGSNAFGTGYDIEQPLSGSATGPTNSVLDLYELKPNTRDGDPGTLIGTFSLDSNGVATFSPVPEPTSLALLGLAAGGYVGLARRRRSTLSSRQIHTH